MTDFVLLENKKFTSKVVYSYRLEYCVIPLENSNHLIRQHDNIHLRNVRVGK